MKRGGRVVIRYSSRYEKALPNGSLRCRMEVHRASLACPQRTWTAEDPQPPRDPKRHLLHLKERLPVAYASARVSSMAHRLPSLQKVAHRRHLGADQYGNPGTPAGPLEEKSSAQCRHSGFPVGKEYRGRQRGTRLRWWQEGPRQKTPSAGRHRRIRAQSQGPQRKGYGL